MSIELGSEAPFFKLPGVDGYDHSLDEYGDANVLVLVQYCNHCPYVLAWEDRLMAIARDYSYEAVRIVAVNSNDVANYPEDSFERMKERAEQLDFPFDYLLDEDQSLAHALGAERTPEVFVFDQERKLRYHGAIDDSRDESGVAQNYLREALNSVLDGEKPAVTETEAVGCTGKWKS